MNHPRPGGPPFGQAGQGPQPGQPSPQGYPQPGQPHPQGYPQHPPPPGQPPGPPGYPPTGQPPKRSGSGLTIALLAAGLVLVLVVIGVVALVVRGSDSAGADDPAGDGAHQASCQVYADVVLSSEVWSASAFDPRALRDMYDATLAETTDEQVASLVEEEAAVVVSYYQSLEKWERSTRDALSKGEVPETTPPAEITAQQDEVARVQGAVLEACQDVLPQRDPNQPAPSVTAPPLGSPAAAPLGATPDRMDEN